MKSKDAESSKANAELDEVNNERLETTKKRVARAISILKEWTCSSADDSQKMLVDIAHAANLLEAANQEMTWHCEWFGYDQEVCMQLDEACEDLGYAMSSIVLDEDDIELVKCDVKDGLIKLSKALATLIRWNDPDADVSEV